VESFPAATTIRIPAVAAVSTAALSDSEYSPPREILATAFRPEVEASRIILTTASNYVRKII
jgi:hypothetical protein